jgi:hypothetical protein
MSFSGTFNKQRRIVKSSVRRMKMRTRKQANEDGKTGG